ncbi:tetratricopeptide repeat-containing sulfotransferase family protein [Haliea sp. E17]|uniref:tetratricopeptide repeat-containing sulfotransferase family protein n=1 Tax=Haliea sp. E17 TaxID=3401576 RepID=UPI003AADECC6
MKKNKPKKNFRKSQGIGPQVSIQETFSSPVRQMAFAAAMRLAEEREQRGERRVAESIYSQLLDQCPGRNEPAIRLLNSFILRGEFETARVQAYRVAALFRNDAEVLVEVARFFQQAGEPEKALELLDETLQRPDFKDRHIMLRATANAYLEQGRTEQAVGLFKQALELCDSDVSILFGLARADRKNSGADVLERLLALCKADTARPEEVPVMHFALAYLYEGRDNDRYFHHLKLGNEGLALDHRQEIERLQKRREMICAHATAEFFQSFAPRSPDCPSPVFIVGPPRSGTTLVEQILNAHPETRGVGESIAFVAAINRVLQEEREAADILSWSPARIEPCLERLERYFFDHRRIPEEARNFTVIDKGIENLDFVGLILLTWPDARIVRMKRHPLDTILSCYHQYFVNGRNTFFNLEALAHFFVNYHQTMDYWEQLFPDRVLAVEYEQLVQDQEAVTRRLLEFCRLPWNDACLQFHRQVSTVLTASNLQVRKPLYARSVARWAPFEKELAPAIRILERDLDLSFTTSAQT